MGYWSRSPARSEDTAMSRADPARMALCHVERQSEYVECPDYGVVSCSDSGYTSSQWLTVVMRVCHTRCTAQRERVRWVTFS
jgi:hypothetical protein